MIIPQPKAAEIYYDICGAIDGHSRCLQDGMTLDRKVRTMNWSICVNTTVFVICFVVSWLAYKGCKDTLCWIRQSEFYIALSEQLIHNTFDRINLSRKTSMPDECQAMTDSGRRSGVGLHLTPTKRCRKSKDGISTGTPQKERCRVCKTEKFTLECSECRDNCSDEEETWLCSTRNWSGCFPRHIAENHNLQTSYRINHHSNVRDLSSHKDKFAPHMRAHFGGVDTRYLFRSLSQTCAFSRTGISAYF